MRVTFVQFGGATYRGGLGRCMAEFAVALSKHAQVSIVDPLGGTQEPGAAAMLAGVECRTRIGEELPGVESSARGGAARVAKAIPRFLAVRKWTIDQTRQLAPDVMCSFDFRSAFLAGTSWKLRSIPLVIQLHGWYVPPYMTGYGRWLMRHRADLVVAISHQTRTALRCAGCDPAKLIVIQNPVDVDAISRDAARPLLDGLPGQDAKVRILLPGWFCYGKGQLVAVEAMGALVSQGLDAYLWLAGSKVPGAREEAYFKQTHDAAARLGVAQRVAWLGHREDMPQLMRAATVVILPSVAEGHPRVVLEAMALGKPVIATPVGGVLDMILPEVTGLLFEVGDAKGLAQCIRRVATEPVLAERIGSLGQLHAKTSFSPHRHAQMLMEAFDLAIRTRKATA